MVSLKLRPLPADKPDTITPIQKDGQIIMPEPSEADVSALRYRKDVDLSKFDKTAPDIPINLSYKNIPEDTKQYIAKLLLHFENKLDRSVPTTFKEVQEKADKLGIGEGLDIALKSADKVTLKDINIKMTAASQAIDHLGVLVERQIKEYYKTAKPRINITNRRMEEPDPAELDEVTRKTFGLIGYHTELLVNITNMKTELGRGMAVGRMVSDVAPTQLSKLQELFSQTGSNMGPDQMETMRSIIEGYAAIPDMKRNGFLNELNTKSKITMDILTEVWINSLLASPTTHIVNTVSNYVNGLISVPERAMAAGVGAARNKIRVMLGKTPDERIRLREASAMMIGQHLSFLEALKGAGRVYMTEQPTGGFSKLEMGQRKAITAENISELLPFLDKDGGTARAVDFLGKWTFRQPGRFLMAEDEFFKSSFKYGEWYALHARRMGELLDQGMSKADAERQATEEIFNNPKPETVQRLEEAAAEKTFQAPTEGLMKKFQVLQSHPLAKPFVPFLRTPTNIFKQLVDKTPLPLLDAALYGVGKRFGQQVSLGEYLGLSDFVKNVKEGGPKADLALGKMATGSSILGALYTSMELAGDDVMFTGGMPTDRKSREAWQRANIQEYAVHFRQDDGTWKGFSYNRFEPISGLLAMVANYRQLARFDGSEEIGDQLEQMALAMSAGLYHYTTSLPMLAGVAEFSQSVAFGGEGLEGASNRLSAFSKQYIDAAAQTGQSLATLGIMPPSLSNMLNKQFADPIKRANMPEEHGHGKFMYNVWSTMARIRSGIPGVSDGMQPRKNRWFEDVPHPEYAWSPIRVTNSKYNAVDNELIRNNIGLNMPQRRYKGVRLSAGQYNKMLEYSNHPERSPNFSGEAPPSLLTILNDTIKSDLYQGIELAKDKEIFLQNALTKRDQQARELMLMEYPDLQQSIIEAEAKRMETSPGIDLETGPPL